MTAIQKEDVNMFNNVLEFLSQNESIVNSSVTFKEDATEFMVKMTQLEEKIDDKNGIESSAAANKANLKISIAENADLMFSFLRRHATKNNDEALKKAVNYSMSGIKTLSDSDFYDFCRKTDEIFRQNADVLTNHAVTPEKQATILAQLGLFKILRPKVKLNQTKRSVTNEEVTECVKSVKDLLTNMMDVSVKTVKDTNPELVRQYELNRQRREPSRSVTQVVFVVERENSATPVSSANVVIPELNFVGVTDDKGQLTLKTGRAKSIVGTISANGMQTQDFTVSSIIRGTTTTINVKLKVGETILMLH